jgi:Lon protease-like protein
MRVGLFPLPDVVLFPGAVLPLLVFEPRYRALVADAIELGGLIGVPRLKRGFEADYHGNPRIFEVFGVGQLVQHELLSDGRYRIVLRGVHRARLSREVILEPYRIAEAAVVTESETEGAHTVRALQATLHDQVVRLSRHSATPFDVLLAAMRAAEAAGVSADLVAAALIGDSDERQALLEEPVASRRMVSLIGRLAQFLGPLEASESGELSN